MRRRASHAQDLAASNNAADRRRPQVTDADLQGRHEDGKALRDASGEPHRIVQHGANETALHMPGRIGKFRPRAEGDLGPSLRHGERQELEAEVARRLGGCWAGSPSKAWISASDKLMGGSVASRRRHGQGKSPRPQPPQPRARADRPRVGETAIVSTAWGNPPSPPVCNSAYRAGPVDPSLAVACPHCSISLGNASRHEPPLPHRLRRPCVGHAPQAGPRRAAPPQGMDADLWQRLFLGHAKLYLEGSKAPDNEFKDFKNHVLHTRDGYWGGAPDKGAAGTSTWSRRSRSRTGRRRSIAPACSATTTPTPCIPSTPPSRRPRTTFTAPSNGASPRPMMSCALGEGEFRQHRPSSSARTPTGWRSWSCRAPRANAYYEKLIAHYDIQRGVVDPPAGLDQVAAARHRRADPLRRRQLRRGARPCHRGSRTCGRRRRATDGGDAAGHGASAIQADRPAHRRSERAPPDRAQVRRTHRQARSITRLETTSGSFAIFTPRRCWPSAAAALSVSGLPFHPAPARRHTHRANRNRPACRRGAR